MQHTFQKYCAKPSEDPLIHWTCSPALQAMGPFHLSRKYSSSSWLMSQVRCQIFSLVPVFWLLGFSVSSSLPKWTNQIGLEREGHWAFSWGHPILGLLSTGFAVQKALNLLFLVRVLAGLLSLAQQVKNPPAIQETWVRSLGREDPLEEEMATHSSVLAWKKSHGQRILVGYSPWGHKGSNTTEHACMQGSSLLSLGPQSNRRTSLTENNTISLFYFAALEKFFIFTIMKFTCSTEGLWSLPWGWWRYSLLGFLVVLALKIMDHSWYFSVSLQSKLWV